MMKGKTWYQESAWTSFLKIPFIYAGFMQSVRKTMTDKKVTDPGTSIS